VAENRPEAVARLLQLVEKARADLGDSAVQWAGANVRPAGQSDDEPLAPFRR
jgi:hypothetical protein